MKQLTIRSISLLLALLMVLLMVPTVNAYSVSTWAAKEVSNMRDMELVPKQLLDTNLSTSISRLNMCRISVLSYERLTGTTIKVSDSAPFSDTSDPDVAKAYAAGLVSGSQGKFNPNGNLTREEFVAFVAKFLNAVGYEAYNSDYASLSGFRDASSVTDWAKDEMQLAAGLGIIQGDSSKNLNPQGQATAEQALLMFYRTYITALKGLNGSYSNTASWASDAVNEMDAMGLVPDTVAYSSMTGNITRAEMCKIVMNTYWHIHEGYSDMGSADISPFSDTDSIDIIDAYMLDIVNGDGNGRFLPNAPITRQDFFKITYNFLLSVGFIVEDDGSVNLRDYADSNQLSDYAVESTKALISLGIVKGDSAKKLHPKDNIAAQEAILIFHRTYEYIINWIGGPSYEDETQQKIQEVIALALAIEADDSLWYVYGGKKPEDGGFDCSGFVSYVYNQKGGKNFTPPCSSIWRAIPDSNIIPKDQLQPGDIVFFHTGSSTTDFQHVGIYIGDGQFVHAANSRSGITISSLDQPYYISHYMNAKRVFM